MRVAFRSSAPAALKPAGVPMRVSLASEAGKGALTSVAFMLPTPGFEEGGVAPGCEGVAPGCKGVASGCEGVGLGDESPDCEGAPGCDGIDTPGCEGVEKACGSGALKPGCEGVEKPGCEGVA